MKQPSGFALRPAGARHTGQSRPGQSRPGQSRGRAPARAFARARARAGAALALGLCLPLAAWALPGDSGPAELAQPVSFVPPAAEMPPEAFFRSRPALAVPVDALQGHATEPLYGLEMPWGEPRFESFRAAYLSEGGRKWLEAVLLRASPYLSYISERLAYYGLPGELAFLPAIESEFSAKAVSKSGAMGLWQFMRNSIGGYGIRIDDWVDERRDFMKSTDAALRKLADNYAYFGDWELAIAAYNAGRGAISRAAKAAGSADYWELGRRGFLPKETLNYVPKFLAAASILSYAGRAGIPASWSPARDWESLELGRSVDLGILASALGLPLEELRAANAELRYSVTPPYPGYRLKLPAGQAGAVQALLDDPSKKLLRYQLHKVRSGDTLSAISRDYGTPQPMILEANPGLKPDLLRLGQVLVVPALGEGPAPGSKRPGPLAARAEEGEQLEFSGAYVVQKGDTLWAISLRYEVQPELLAEKNGLELGSTIREGMRLLVPILKP